MNRKPKPDFTLADHGEVGVIITRDMGRSGFYPYDPVHEYLEVNVDIDHEKIRIMRDRHGDEHWTYRRMRNPHDRLAAWTGREWAVRYLGENAIAAAEKRVRARLRELRRAVKAAALHPAYAKMKAIVDRRVKYYASDFNFHDCLSLGINNPDRFLWMVRSTGTWLLSSRSKAARQIIDYVLKNERSQHEYYWWDGRDVHQIEPDHLGEYYLALPFVEEKTP